LGGRQGAGVLNEGLIPALPKALSGWYADPLDPGEANKLLQHGEQTAQHAYRHGNNALYGELEQTLARYSQSQPIDSKLEALAATPNLEARALVLLIHGQLLMSRRIEGAREYLEQGFELARDHFLAPDFFAVMKRHELLAELPLYPQARKAQSLISLLNEAGVILRLRGRRPPVIQRGPVDTMG